MGYPALQADSLPAEFFILYLSLPGKLIYIYIHICYSPWGHKELDMTERLSTAYTHTHTHTHTMKYYSVIKRIK